MNFIPFSARLEAIVMRHSRVLFLIFVSICLVGGCRRGTPVEEVSLNKSGVTIAETGLAELAGQWPQWRGPNGDGNAGEQIVPTSWSESENIRFRSDIPGRGHSSPIVVGNLVVLGSAIESESKQLVIAFDRTTGEKVWETIVHEGGFPSRRSVHQKATNANSTIASDGEILVTTHLNQERIYATALDTKGEKLWQTEVGAFASKFGYAPSPVLYQSLVIVAADNFGGGYLAALDRQTGQIAWRIKRGDASSYSSPAIANVDGMDQLLISGNDRIASYDPSSGKLNWETDGIAEATCGTIVATENKIFASGGYPDKETVCLSGSGERLWENNTKVYEPSLVTNGSELFAVTDNGIAYCWSIEDGKQLWRKRLGGSFSSSPVLCSGNVYVCDLSGNGYVFKATGDPFELVSKNQLGNDCYASPAIVEGAIYLRIGVGSGSGRKEQLVCIATENESL